MKREKQLFTMVVPIVLSLFVVTLSGCDKDDDKDPGDDLTGKPTEVVEIYNPVTMRTWMDRNMGASRAATSLNDPLSYGDLYQWGRGKDGHQLRTSDTTSALSTSPQPDHDLFITTMSYQGDWLSTPSNTLWQGVDGENNPCPEGFRLPTIAEWEDEVESWNNNGGIPAFASAMKLSMAGGRIYYDGTKDVVGITGMYWTSTVVNSNALVFLVAVGFDGNYTGTLEEGVERANGHSVRCIKD